MNAILERLEEWGAAPEEAISARMMDDEEIYMKLLKSLLEGDHVEKFRDAVREKRLNDAYFEIHHIKGSVGILGLAPLFDSAELIIKDIHEENMESLSREAGHFLELFREFRRLMDDPISAGG